MKREVVAFRAFLVLLGACILVPFGLWINELRETSYWEGRAAADELTIKTRQDNCDKAVSRGFRGSADCGQIPIWQESRNRNYASAYQHRGDARDYLLTLFFLPLSLALCFYAGRWILTGRLRPFWLLHDD